jgi:uncharacterized membrane protein YebE (DUF533 family)
MKTIAIAAIIASIFAATAFAQSTNTPVVDNRQNRQDARIEQGKATGQLNKREAARMEAGQAKVDGMEAAAKADGKVTKTERRAIKREQNKQSKRIYKQKHDAQTKNPS